MAGCALIDVNAYGVRSYVRQRKQNSMKNKMKDSRGLCKAAAGPGQGGILLAFYWIYL